MQLEPLSRKRPLLIPSKVLQIKKGPIGPFLLPVKNHKLNSHDTRDQATHKTENSALRAYL